MPLDPRIEAALALLPKRDETGLTAAERRALRSATASELSKELLKHLPAPLPSETDLLVETFGVGVPVRVYRPREGLLPALIAIHGGGWWLGNLDEGDGGCRWRAQEADCVVIAVDYRLAPEYPFPAAIDDCWAATQWVFENADTLGIDPNRIAIQGGSAGANLAAAVTLLARASGSCPLVGQVLDVPCTDLTLRASRSSAEEFASGYGLSKADTAESAELYLQGADPTDFRASPLLADLSDLPPAFVNTCEFDPVRDDGEAYARKLADAGVPTTLHRWLGQVHGSMEISVVVPDIAAEYRTEVGEFLRSVFAKG
jgi:acetyl esterase